MTKNKPLKINDLTLTRFSETPFMTHGLCTLCGSMHDAMFIDGVDEQFTGMFQCLTCKRMSCISVAGMTSTAN